MSPPILVEEALQLIQESLSDPLDNEDELEKDHVKETETEHNASVSVSSKTSCLYSGHLTGSAYTRERLSL